MNVSKVDGARVGKISIDIDELVEVVDGRTIVGVVFGVEVLDAEEVDFRVVVDDRDGVGLRVGVDEDERLDDILEVSR